ncbi:MAG: hypothetical protein V9F01_08035 [Chitinophagaceae bacterium]
MQKHFQKRKKGNKKNFAFPYQLLLGNEVEEFEKHLDDLNNLCELTLLQPFSSKDETIEYYSWKKKKVNISAALNSFPVSTPKVKFGCVNCRPARCFEYSEEELKCSDKTLQEIPDKNPEQVCPVNAISFNSNLFPELDYNKCVDCGICISRCNYRSNQLSKRQTCNHSTFVKKEFSNPFVC